MTVSLYFSSENLSDLRVEVRVKTAALPAQLRRLGMEKNATTESDTVQLLPYAGTLNFVYATDVMMES